MHLLYIESVLFEQRCCLSGNVIGVERACVGANNCEYVSICVRLTNGMSSRSLSGLNDVCSETVFD